MYLGISSQLEHSSPQDWAAKHVALGLKSVNFPVSYIEGEDKFMAYKKAADEAGLVIAEVGVWRNTLAADPQERRKWIDYAVGQLRMADEIGAKCCVNVVGTSCGPRWDGGYRGNFSPEIWKEAVAMIREIIDTARPKNAKFSIESMPWMIPSSPDEYVRLIEDVDRARQPLYTTGGEERSGMGFTIMESFMDTLRVRSSPGRGTTVTMQRRIRRRGGAV